MNNIIKVIFPLLLILSGTYLYSDDLVIKIPQKFHNEYLPLPPFPEESVNKLEEVDYNKKLEILDVRYLEQNEISYKYYFEILNLNIKNRYSLDGKFIIGTGENSLIYTGINTEATSNNFGVEIYSDYNLESSETFLGYSEFRFPVELQTFFYPESLSFKLSGKYRDYNNLFYVMFGYSSNYIYDLELKIDTLLYPQIKVSNIEDNLLVCGALNYKSSKLRISPGFIYTNDNAFPKLNLIMDHNIAKTKISTILSESELNYSLITSYKNIIEPGLGFGYNIGTNYEPINPEVIITTSYKLFNGEVRLWKNYFKAYLSFINDNITSIISLKLSTLDKFEINYEQEYKNLSLESGLSKEENDYGFFIAFGYKVVI